MKRECAMNETKKQRTTESACETQREERKRDIMLRADGQIMKERTW